MNTQPSILVGCEDKVVWIKVEGKGFFLNSGGLKDFTRQMVDRGYREFVVDLKNCPVMDSTFMGTLAGLALRLRELGGGGGVRVVNLNDRNHDLLTNLGLDQLFSFDEKPISEESTTVPVRRISADGEDKAEQARTMLEAHEALVEAVPGNLVKFKDVLEYLRQDLGATE